MLRAFGVTDKGRVRSTNEDCFGIDADLQLCVVADGMGGHNAGEVASRLAVDAVFEQVAASRDDEPWPFGYEEGLTRRSNILRTAVMDANRRVFEAAAAEPAYAGMGTTIVAVLADAGGVSVAHVGDSRLYSVQGGLVEQVTADDSWTAVMLARDPSIDPAILKTHPMRNALTSVIGSRASVEVHLAERPLRDGECLVLTSDGVHGVVTPEMLADAVVAEPEPERLADALVTLAMEKGSRDNCTALVVRCSAGSAEGDARRA